MMENNTADLKITGCWILAEINLQIHWMEIHLLFPIDIKHKKKKNSGEPFTASPNTLWLNNGHE